MTNVVQNISFVHTVNLIIIQSKTAIINSKITKCKLSIAALLQTPEIWKVMQNDAFFTDRQLCKLPWLYSHN